MIGLAARAAAAVIATAARNEAVREAARKAAIEGFKKVKRILPTHPGRGGVRF